MSEVKKDYLAVSIIGVSAALLSKVMIVSLELKISWVFLGIFIFVTCIAGVFVGRLVRDKIPFLYQFAKFGETGGLNTFVDLGVLNLLLLVSGISGGIYYSVFKAISFIAAVANSYLWNKFWVFSEEKRKQQASSDEVTKFFIVSAIGFLINVSVATLFVKFGASIVNIHGNLMANVGAVAAFAFTMLFNFLGYKIFVFKK